MRPENKGVKTGNISTYEQASDAFLKRRAQDIRSAIRNPHLTPSEFTQNVGGQTAFTGLAAGWSIWNALNKGFEWAIQNNPADKDSQTLSAKFKRFLEPFINKMKTGTNGKIGLMRNADGYESVLNSVSGQLSDFLFAKDPTIEQGLDVLQAMIDEPKSLGHTSGSETLAKGKERLSKITDVDEFKKEFKALLKEVHFGDKQRHIGKYFLIWSQMDRIAERRPIKREDPGLIQRILGKPGKPVHESGRGRAIMADALNTEVRDILESGRKDNAKIITKYNAWITLPLVAAVTAFVGWRTHKSARRQKMLDLEAEASYIERLLTERAQEKEETNGRSATNAEAPSNHINADSVTHHSLQHGVGVAQHAAQNHQDKLDVQRALAQEAHGIATG